MSVTSINETKAARELKSSFWDKIAKKAVFRALQGIERGRIIIEHDGEVAVFGQSAEDAEIVAHIFVHHDSFYRDLLFGGSIGAGEAYMLGSWSSSNLLDVIRLMVVNLSMLNKMDNTRPLLARLSSKFMHSFNANTLTGSKKNIAAHYDLGNEFFSLFLDPTMMYSSAIYPSSEATLEEASIYKLDSICQKLCLTENDHLMEVGTGWGGLAIHAAKNYGCKVTTTTISKEQYEYACEAVKKEGLEDKITLLLKDYRDLEGDYDKLVFDRND